MKVIAAPSFFECLKRIGSFKEKYYELCSWIKYHLFNKNFKELHRVVMKTYPWDIDYLYELEKAKINEMCKYHQKSDRFAGVEYVIRDMKICMKLIDIFSGKVDLFHYDGDIFFEKIDDTAGYRLLTTPDFKYNCDVYINTKNVNRFCENEDMKKYFLEHPHELYMEKAKHLYHKIRLERDNTWWD